MSSPDSGRRIAVIGLGYVGLPIAVGLAKHHAQVVGLDISRPRVEGLRRGEDQTGEVSSEQLAASRARFTSNPEDLAECDFFIVTVPTPIHDNKQPNLEPLRSSSTTVGGLLKKGDIVVYESTVYPGVTEDFCAPILENVSGLKRGADFGLGYSPERINPGDPHRSVETITKVVSADTPETLEVVRAVYGPLVEAGLFAASSIKVAEAAKVIENTQRDLNIALMNEFAMIFDRLDIPTRDVLEAAGTKWNFLKFTPGLVGGHCIGVDPYYLTTAAQNVGYHPEVILAGRRINDNMGAYVAAKAIQMASAASPGTPTRVGVVGVTFKPNVPDLRNTKVVSMIEHFQAFGMTCLVHDAMVTPEELEQGLGLQMSPLEEFRDLDILVLAVPHAAYRETQPQSWVEMLRDPKVLVDVGAMLDEDRGVKSATRYWAL